MERLAAGELLDAATAASVPWMDDDDRVEVVAELRRRAEGSIQKEKEKEWGGGYRDDVESISMEDLRGELKRGV